MLIEKQGNWFTAEGEELTLIPQTRRAEHLLNGASEVVGKKCGGKCGEMLPIDQFRKCSKGFAQKRSYCRECQDLNYRTNQEGKNLYGEKKRKVKPKAERKYQDGICTAKKCPTCDVWKDRKDYYEANGPLDGLSSSCRSCLVDLMRQSVAKDPERYRTYGQNRRAKEEALPGHLSGDQWKETLDYFEGACALTGSTDDLHLEHAIPIAIGHGGTVAWNCYPLAGSLNSSKSASNLFEWAKGRTDTDKAKFNRLVTFLADQCGLTVEEYREFYDWCFRNPRLTVVEIEADGEVESLELWSKEKRHG
jgi:hypothetical protein